MNPALIIDPSAVYEEGVISLTLGIPLASLAKARRTGELRFVRRGRRVFITGKNLLAWLEPTPSNPEKESEVVHVS